MHATCMQYPDYRPSVESYASTASSYLVEDIELLPRIYQRQHDKPGAFGWPFIYSDLPYPFIDVCFYSNRKQNISELAFYSLLSLRDRFADFLFLVWNSRFND